MDNNNFNGQMGGQPNMPPNPQPQPNMQPGMQPNMQMNNQMGPMSQPMPMQPNMGQGPYPQQMMKPPKKPMDPAKKKKIILIIVIVSLVLIVGIALAIILPIVLRVDYSSTYSTAKELKPKIYDIYSSSSCEDVVDYVTSDYADIKEYSDYIEKCKKVYGSSADDLVTKLENTDGVKRNNEIKAQFDKFKSEYTALSAGDNETLSAKLDLWQARHNFYYTTTELKYGSSSDAEFTRAANYLIESGNDSLKTYGEGWLERSLAISAAYRAWDNTGYFDSNKSQLYNDYNNKKKELSDWAAENKPDINTIAPLNFNDTSKMYSEFGTLYDLITATYEENYNSDSGDCTEFLGEVHCD